MPRLAARLKIPLAASWLKKYFGATAGCNISASEHSEYALSSLGHAEVSRVHNPVASRKPDVSKRTQDGFKVAIFVHIPFTTFSRTFRRRVDGGEARKQSGNIFPDQKLGSKFIDDPYHFVEETGTRTTQASSITSNRKILTGKATGDNIHRFEIVFSAFRNIKELFSIGPVTAQHTLTSFVDLDLPERSESVSLEA